MSRKPKTAARAKKPRPTPKIPEGTIRLHKMLAEAGVASRRAAEQMIREGRVTVNRKGVTTLPCFVDPSADVVRVDGRPVQARQQKVYFLLNKPRGVVCTQRDPEGRTRAADLIPPTRQRIYCVGRLDAESTGVIVLTNDGELTQLLTHPKHGVVKTYVADVAGRVAGASIDKIKGGVWLAGGRTQRARLKILKRGPERTLLEIQLSEGRNREVRRVLARLGHNVRRLKRTAIGPITDRGLKIGSYRALTGAEVARLRRSVRSPNSR